MLVIDIENKSYVIKMVCCHDNRKKPQKEKSWLLGMVCCKVSGSIMHGPYPVLYLVLSLHSLLHCGDVIQFSQLHNSFWYRKANFEQGSLLFPGGSVLSVHLES